MYFKDEPEHITILRDTLRRFAEKEAPRESVREWDRECRFPKDVFRKLADLGVCGLTVEENFGGSGIDIVAAIAVIEELSRKSTALAGPYIHCAFYGGLNIGESGSPQQKEELLPRIAKGDVIFAYGLSEPDVGGELANVKTTARKSSDGKSVIIIGTKPVVHLGANRPSRHHHAPHQAHKHTLRRDYGHDFRGCGGSHR